MSDVLRPRLFTTADNSPRELLTCWKEIAAYFGKGVRTVQRWEHIGMPCIVRAATAPLFSQIPTS